MEDKLALITGNPKEFLKFLKSRYLLIHQSNVFFRDIHYGVMAYLEVNRRKFRYLEAEELANAVVASLEKSDILKPLDNKTWLLNYPEFKLAPSKPAVVAKPAAPAARPAVPAPSKPAGAGPAGAKPAAALTPPAPAVPPAGEAPTQ